MDKLNIDDIDINDIDPSYLLEYLLSLSDYELQVSFLKLLDKYDWRTFDDKFPDIISENWRINKVLNDYLHDIDGIGDIDIF